MDPSLWIVVAAAGLTAIITGVRALPFLFANTPGPRTVGWANVVAGGPMLAASRSLIDEGVSLGVGLRLLGLCRASGPLSSPTVCFPIRARSGWPICGERTRARRF